MKLLLILCLVFVVSVSAQWPCFPQTRQYNGKSYHFFNNCPKSFEDAQTFCHFNGYGSLVKIHNSQENQWIGSQIPGYNTRKYWIGLRRYSCNDMWLWRDGSGLGWNNWGRDKWGRWQPNCIFRNYEYELCAHLHWSQLYGFYWSWTDAVCSMQNNFVCKSHFPPVPAPPPVAAVGPGPGPAPIAAAARPPAAYARPNAGNTGRRRRGDPASAEASAGDSPAEELAEEVPAEELPAEEPAAASAEEPSAEKPSEEPPAASAEKPSEEPPAASAEELSDGAAPDSQPAGDVDEADDNSGEFGYRGDGDFGGEGLVADVV